MAQKIIHRHLHINLIDGERERKKQIEFIEFLELCGFEFQLNLDTHSVAYTHTQNKENVRTNM